MGWLRHRDVLSFGDVSWIYSRAERAKCPNLDNAEYRCRCHVDLKSTRLPNQRRPTASCALAGTAKVIPLRI